MAGLFKSNRTNNQDPEAFALRISASVQGTPIPIGCGQTRWAPILIDYAGFTASPVSGGGKGGLAGSGGKGNTGQYNYSASGLMLLGEGPITQICMIFNGNNVDFLVAPTAQMLADLNAIGIPSTDITTGNGTYNTIFHDGDYSQVADSWWASNYASDALAYRGLSYAIWPNLQLGTSPSWPSFNIEATWGINSDIPALGPDANPADWVQAFLTNADWGVQGFPPSAIGDFNTARNYWRATGMLISLTLASAVSANSHLKSLMDALNCEFRQSGAAYDIVPYGDVVVTGNGYTYTPNTTPVYDLGPDDFLPNQGTLGQGSMTGKSFLAFMASNPLDVFNKLQVKYFDRTNLYNPVTFYVTDDGSITATGRIRLSDLKDNSFFNLASAAIMSASLQLQRLQASMRQWQITVGRQFVLLDVLDIVALSEPSFQLVNQLCRITEIDENADSTLTLTMEEVPLTASSPVYNTQQSLGYGRFTNAPPSSVNPPFFFEPADQLAGGLVLEIGLSGQLPENFGGCQVWYSIDGQNYSELGVFDGATRMGVLTALLPSITAAPAGQTIDTTNTLAVNMAESGGELTSVSPAAFASLATLSVVDGEVLAYETATLLSGETYDLTTLSRGAYGSSIAAHAIGAPFMRLDGSAFEWTFTSDLIGTTVYFKFLAFNQFGVATQQLSDVGAYPYVIQGSALFSPLPNVTDLYSNYEAGFQKVYWDEIQDFRYPISYEIRQGSTWDGALPLRTQLHPPFIAQGNGTFWVAAKFTAAGKTIYSATPQSVTISGNQLSLNLLATYDEQANDWPGTKQSPMGVDGVGANAFLRLGGSQNVLAENPFLASAPTTAATASGNVLTIGGGVPAGVVVGMAVADKTTPSAIPANVIIAGIVGNLVTLSGPVVGGGVLNGDTIVFSVGDVLNSGGIVTNTPVYYTSSQVVNCGYVTQAAINASIVIAGVPVGQNILADQNVLTDQDILGSSSTAFVSGWVEIAIGSIATPNDAFAPPDAFGVPDIFAPLVWGPWQKFVPGVFSGQTFRFRLALQTSDPNSIPYALAFNWQVQLPARIDHYLNQSIASGGATIVFEPDYAATPGAFNGGPDHALPAVQVDWGMQTAVDYTISGLSLSQLTVQFFDSTGSPTAATGVSIIVEGY
jgi:hypothetical protein